MKYNNVYRYLFFTIFYDVFLLIIGECPIIFLEIENISVVLFIPPNTCAILSFFLLLVYRIEYHVEDLINL